MRVGEITRLNISDMNFQERSCIVLDKGNSEREVYLTTKSKMYIKKYLQTRTDDNEALFVSLIKPYNRLGISGIEILIRNFGRKANINKVYPHKFRRTKATMEYATVNQKEAIIINSKGEILLNKRSKWITIDEFEKMIDNEEIIPTIDFDKEDYKKCLEL